MYFVGHKISGGGDRRDFFKPRTCLYTNTDWRIIAFLNPFRSSLARRTLNGYMTLSSMCITLRKLPNGWTTSYLELDLSQFLRGPTSGNRLSFPYAETPPPTWEPTSTALPSHGGRTKLELLGLRMYSYMSSWLPFRNLPQSGESLMRDVFRSYNCTIVIVLYSSSTTTS